MGRNYKDSESLLRSMMESLDQLMIWAVDREYRYLFFNNSHRTKMKQFWGADIELGENIFNYITDPNYAAEVRKKYNAVFTDWSGVSIDPLEDIDGHVRHFENYGSPVFGENREIIGLVLYTIEVTDRVQAEKELERLSVTDKLTGLYNRNKLDDVLEQEYFRAIRYDRQFSILMADIDHFKEVNDTYGHVAGDKVLEAIGRMLKENTRIVDTSGRWGGEEFIMICPETECSQAVQIAEKIRSMVEQHNFTPAGRITWSIGIAEFHHEKSISSLIEKADDALYRAKKEGRNRVV